MSQDQTTLSANPLRQLYEDFAGGAIGRRDFMRRSAALGVAGAAAAALGSLAAAGSAEAGGLAQQTMSA